MLLFALVFCSCIKFFPTRKNDEKCLLGWYRKIYLIRNTIFYMFLTCKWFSQNLARLCVTKVYPFIPSCRYTHEPPKLNPTVYSRPTVKSAMKEITLNLNIWIVTGSFSSLGLVELRLPVSWNCLCAILPILCLPEKGNSVQCLIGKDCK